MLIFFRKNKFYQIFLLFILISFSNTIKANIIRDAEIENFLTEMANPIFEAANLNLNSVDIYIFNENFITNLRPELSTLQRGSLEK